MRDIFGVSTICNIIGAIKMAKYLNFNEDDNIVTVATDGFDRYQSVMEDLSHRVLEISDYVLTRWFKDIFIKTRVEDILDVRGTDQKERLFKQKENDWLKFGYQKAYLDEMKDMSFWDNEYKKIKHYNEKIKQMRGNTYD
jgi:cysteine synthase